PRPRAGVLGETARRHAAVAPGTTAETRRAEARVHLEGRRMDDRTIESRPTIWLPVAAAVVAALVGVVVVPGCYMWFGFDRIAALLIGLGVGAAIRFTDRTGDPRLPWLAVGLTIASAVAGMAWVDQAMIQWLYQGQPVQPTLGDTFGRLTRDLSVILFTALGAYFAYVVARRA
ncbi:MAG: hypothetical protein WD118_03005, partial [Phycisphaeraceae bacterium]